MGLLQRLFGATVDAFTLPQFDGSNAVNISVTILRECIDRGSVGPQAPIRSRLDTPFARGYLFGFSDASIQRFGVFDELESLALITVIHETLFGQEIGGRLVHDALRDQRNVEFARGRTAGDEDHFRWRNDRSYAPRSLTDYLLKHDDMSSPNPAKGNAAAEAGIDTAGVPSRSDMAIWLRKRLHIKPVKPISH
jgi:hypothetical protein